MSGEHTPSVETVTEEWVRRRAAAADGVIEARDGAWAATDTGPVDDRHHRVVRSHAMPLQRTAGNGATAALINRLNGQTAPAGATAVRPITVQRLATGHGGGDGSSPASSQARDEADTQTGSAGGAVGAGGETVAAPGTAGGTLDREAHPPAPAPVPPPPSPPAPPTNDMAAAAKVAHATDSQRLTELAAAQESVQLLEPGDPMVSLAGMADAGPAPSPDQTGSPTAGAGSAPAANDMLTLEVPAMPGDSAEEFFALIATDRDGQMAVRAAVETAVADLRAGVNAEVAQVDSSVSTAEAAITSSVTSARRHVQQAAGAAQARIDGARAAQAAVVTQQLDSKKARGRAEINRIGTEVELASNRRADEAQHLSEGAADQIDGARSRFVTAAQQKAEAKSRQATSAAEEAEIRRASIDAQGQAAREVATQTERSIDDAIASSVRDLRGGGPQLHAAVAQQVGPVVQQIRDQATPVESSLTTADVQIASALDGGVSSARSALQTTARGVIGALSQLETQSKRNLRRAAETTKSGLQQVAESGESELRAQPAQVTADAHQELTSRLQQISSRPLRRELARTLSSELSAVLQSGYGMSAAHASQLGRKVAGQLTSALAEFHREMQAGSQHAAQEAEHTGQSGGAQLARQEQQVVQFLAATATGALNGVETSLSGTLSRLGELVGQVDHSLAPLVDRTRERVDADKTRLISEAESKTGDLDDRMFQAMRHAREKVEEGAFAAWLNDQVRALGRAMLTPSFWAGLLVGLLVTIFIIATFGTGFAVLVVAGAVAGALAAGASYLAQVYLDPLADSHAERRQFSWGEMGTQMLVGGIFGAIGGAAGAGVAGGLGANVASATARTLLVNRAAQTVVGTVLGVVQNIITGPEGVLPYSQWHWDRADQGLVTNLVVSTAMTSRTMEHVTGAMGTRARNAMVDRGIAVNTTPAEIHAAQARMETRAGLDPLPEHAAAPASPPASGAAAAGTTSPPPVTAGLEMPTVPPPELSVTTPTGPAVAGPEVAAPAASGGGSTPWPMASPAGEPLRLSYPTEGGAFRYEAGPQPEQHPFANLSDAQIEHGLSGLDAVARGDTPAPGTATAGQLQQGNIAPFEPRMPENRNNPNYRNPLDPPGQFAYGSEGAPADGPFHGAMGRSGVDAEGHPAYFPAEVFGVTPASGPSYAVRVGPPGAYVDHVFLTLGEARSYADGLAARGEAPIRSESALPHNWPGGAAGNPVDAVRVFEIPPESITSGNGDQAQVGRPFLRSGVAPQPESRPGASGSYAGGGPQVQLPYGTVGRGTEPVYQVPVLDRQAPVPATGHATPDMAVHDPAAGPAVVGGAAPATLEAHDPSTLLRAGDAAPSDAELALQASTGTPVRNQREFLRIASESGVHIDVRQTNPEAPRRLAEGNLPKPEAIKAKSINDLDVHLGFRAEDVGLVGYRVPDLPDLAGVASELHADIMKRYHQRLQEFADLGPAMTDLQRPADSRSIDHHGFGGSVVVDEHGVIRTANPAGEMVGFTGDHDIFQIRDATTGQPLTGERYNALVSRLRSAGIGVEHGAHMHWSVPTGQEGIFHSIVDRHAGREPLVTFGTDGVSRTTASEQGEAALASARAAGQADQAAPNAAAHDPFHPAENPRLLDEGDIDSLLSGLGQDPAPASQSSSGEPATMLNAGVPADPATPAVRVEGLPDELADSAPATVRDPAPAVDEERTNPQARVPDGMADYMARMGNGDRDAQAYFPVDDQTRAALDQSLGAPRVEPRTGGLGDPQFGPLDLVYGPSAGGALRELSSAAGGRILSDVATSEIFPNWFAKSRLALDWARSNGATVHFDLTNMADVDAALAGSGDHGGSVTAFELRYVRDHWQDAAAPFRDVVRFYRNGQVVPAPWEATAAAPRTAGPTFGGSFATTWPTGSSSNNNDRDRDRGLDRVH